MHELSIFIILKPGVNSSDDGSGDDVGADGNHGVNLFGRHHQISGVGLQQILHSVQNHIFIFGIEINLGVAQAALDGFIDDGSGVHDGGYADGDDGSVHVFAVDFFVAAADAGAGANTGIGDLDAVADAFDAAGG